MENMTYIKPLVLSVIEFQNSRFSFAASKLFLIPSAFAFYRVERKGGKPVKYLPLLKCPMSNVAYIDSLLEEKLKLRFGVRV